MKKKEFFWKRKNARNPGGDALPEPYFEGVSEKLGIAQVVLYLGLLAFVVLSFLGNTGLITYRNFYYFFKDLNASVEASELPNTDSLTYPTDDVQSFTLYRQGLAVAGNSSVTIFTATGRQTLSKSINYHNPVAVGSGKYLLVYELGGTRYSVYNSYTQIFSGTSEYPLHGAAVSDSGAYALLSSSAQYTSVVSLFNSNFSLINRYNKVGYVMDVAINSKGSLIAILTSTPSNGVFLTELTVYQPGKGSESAKSSIGTSMALSCSFTDSGDVAVLCTDGITFLTSAGKQIRFYGFDGREPIAADLGIHGLSVCLRATATYAKDMIVAFDKNGRLIYESQTDQRVESLALYRKTLFLMTSDGVVRLDTENGQQTEFLCDTKHKVLLPVDTDEVLLCSPQKAIYIRIDS